MIFLPATLEEFQLTGWDCADFICVTGDAYVDHPSFGIAIIARLLESCGFRVAIISQPSYLSTTDFMVYGKPKYSFLVTSGNIDSMVNNYTVAKKRRAKDIYNDVQNGDTSNYSRPDRACIVYSKKIREAYGNVPIILGGLEASLRRLAHYDYWSNSVRQSILLESTADLIVYGMGENPIREIADALCSGIPITEITFVKGTVYATKDLTRVSDYVTLPSFAETKKSKIQFAHSFKLQYENTDCITANPLVEKYADVYVVQNIPSEILTQLDMDYVYSLPFTRAFHPKYKHVPALEEVKFSIASQRGCFGSCNFCALTFHQGRIVQSRGHDSIVEEAKAIINDPDFKGYIHDVGGPTANFNKPSCQKQLTKGVCKNKLCMFPDICNNAEISHKDYLALLRNLRSLPKIKKVFIRSGIRYDYLIKDRNQDFFNELCEHHVSGQLKVAPEHVSDKVLYYMGKPKKAVYDAFSQKYYAINKKLHKEQYLVPYLMSSHPGSDLKSAVELAEYLRDNRLSPEQVQDFYPTPGTLSTCMYYSEIDPRTGSKVYVPKSPHEKAMQRALIQYRLPQNYELVKKALQEAGRTDLIGFGIKCLIRPRGMQHSKPSSSQKDLKEKKGKKEIAKKKTIRNIHAPKKKG